MLRSKRVNSKTTADIADAIAASLNGQELTKTQRKCLSSSLGSPVVQSVISDMQKTLTSRSDNVSPKPTVRNVGQLYTTVQTANDQGNTSINQEDVAKRLLEKGFYSKSAAGVAEAVAARLNEQDLTRTQRSILSSALSSSAVRDTISEFIQKKADGVDSAKNNGYDSTVGNGNRYETVTSDAAPHQVRDSLSVETYANEPEVTDNIITDGSHLENGKLKPNVTYKSGENGYFYTTNEDGLIVNARTDDLQKKTHKRRLKHNPNTYGKKTGDHAGHLFGDQFGGSPELDNLVSQAKNVNLSEYRRIENRWAKALKNGQKVTVSIDIHYNAGGVRPISFVVSYTIDGVRHRKVIKNL